jgi:exodeoxyribonuclease-3
MLAWVESYRPDVLCLQEIKTRPEQIDPSHFDRLQAAFASLDWHPAQRLGYSGVATLASAPALDVHLGLGMEQYDLEGRVICSRYPEFLLFNIYFPNGRHDHTRVPFKLDFYARLLEHCDTLHSQGEKIILCGDFNTAHREIDLRHPKANQNTTGFLPEERAWIDRYLAQGFVDVYRLLYPQRVQYTWWTYRLNARQKNVGWRLDYFLVSESLVGSVSDVVIHDEVLGSDHCPVALIM